MPFHQPKAKSQRQLANDAEQRARDLAAIADAHHFTCTIFRGHAGYQTARFDTLAGARAHGPILEAEAANHRKAMVYAVTNAGMTHFIPDDLEVTKC